MHTNGFDGGGILTTDGCQHTRLGAEKRQKAIRNTLILRDCLICKTTITVRTEPHNSREAEEMAALVALLAQKG